MTNEEFQEATGIPLEDFAHQCHKASLALVQSGTLGPCRVARGTTRGVGGQHSWVVLGMDCYDPNARIIDPTLWSYNDKVKGVYTGRARRHNHRPHGAGCIWDWGRPDHPTEPALEFDVEWSPSAARFLKLLGPLDLKGWITLAHAPVEGWPSTEIIGVMYDDKRTRAHVPIDIAGMATDRNPGGLYLAQPVPA